MKTNPVSGHEVELLMKIRQRSLPFNPADNPGNIEQFERSAEEWLVIRVEPENVVAKRVANIKEIAGAAAEVEKSQRRRAIHPEVLRAVDVDLDAVGVILDAIAS